MGGALILSGGGARGAYEAGVVDALAAQAGASDGARLPGVDLVCGSSIGALNAWFVATGQYARLRNLWLTVGDQNLFQLKKKYRAIVRPSSGVLTRVLQALSLERGVVSNEQGVFEGSLIERWIEHNVDISRPLLTPMIFLVTSLSKQTGVLYYRLPPYRTPVDRASAVAALRDTFATNVDIREATDDVIHEAIRASAATPVLFDPVSLPGPNGVDRFVDGGIADNTPIDVGRALARTLRVVLVDPATPPDEKPQSALEIGYLAFGVAQRRITENALRSAVFETRAKRLLVSPTAPGAAFRRTLFDVDISAVRPAGELPAEVADFDRADRIRRTFDLGRADGMHGFQPYGLPAKT